MTAIAELPAKKCRALSLDKIRSALRPARRWSLGDVDTQAFAGTDEEFQEYCASLDELDRLRRADLRRISRAIAEHKQEMGREGLNLRLSALQEQLDDAKEDVFCKHKRYKTSATAGRPYIERAIIARFIREDEDRIDRMRREVERIQTALFRPQSASRDNITLDMIERAKEYPLDSLLDAQRGYAICLFHEDRRPSMYIKNNFAYCFSCGMTADTIDVYRKIHGATFSEAVRALQ